MKTILYFSILIVLASSLIAGTTGKIAGQISDADTGEPLAGVNIVVEGTAMGAASDAEGYFSIINLRPGYYTLIFSYIGYAEQKVKQVKVNIDLTSVVNVTMKSGLLTTETVEIIAQRPVVEKDISNSQLNIEAKTINAMPVKSLTKALVLQAGIEESAAGLIIRGGSANQTVFMVDGLSNNDERSSYPYTGVSLSSIEEVQVQTGGFSVKYGQARSGVVNVITKEGSAKKYSGFISIHYQPPAPKHFGISIYDRNSYFNRPYFDPDVMWVGTQNGNWDDYTKRQYPKFEGWNAIADATLTDRDPSNDLTPEGAARLFSYYRRRHGDIEKPDYLADFGFGGPIPFISQFMGNGRFYASHSRSRDMFVFPLSTDSYEKNDTQLKLTSDLAAGIKLMVSGQYAEESSVSPYNWSVPTGRILKTTSEVAALPSSSSTGLSIPFMPDYFSPTKIYRTFFNAKLTHALDKKSFYEVKLQYKISRYNTYQAALRDTTKRYEPVPGYFVDEAPYGYWGYSATGPAAMHLGGWMNLGRDKSTIATTSAFLTYNNQISKHHLIKSGLSFIYNDYNIHAYTENPAMSTWNRSMIYHIFPYRIGAYAADKMEFEGFIANLGLRMDYSDANVNKLILDPYSELFTAAYGNQLEELASKEKAKPSFTVSPRVGISHPITENSKLYFNYGHYRSEPFSSYRFKIQRESNGTVTSIGDPNLGQEKTIAYEVGYEHNLADEFLLKVAGYYKDITDQPGWVYYKSDDVGYYKAANNNYQDIRGFELTLTKRSGRWITGFVNYTYDVSSSGYFGLLKYYKNPKEQRDYLKENPVLYRVHPRPYARANIDLHTPQDYGMKWMSLYPFGGWKLNVLTDWKTGSYYTYNPNRVAGVVDDTQWLDWFNTNLRLSKNLDFKTFKIRFFMDIDNLFNNKYMSRAGFSDNYDWEDYLQSLNFSWEKGVEKGNDKIGDYRPAGVAYDPLEANPDNDPAIKARNDKRKANKSYIDMPNISSLTFLNPRAFTFGITINF